MNIIDSLKWRYATKKFDASKKLSEEQMNQLKEAINLTPTSYGLQAFKVLFIQDQELKKELKTASWNQSQVEDADLLIVFCPFTGISEEYVDTYVDLVEKTRGLEKGASKGYGDFMKKTIGSMDDNMVLAWNTKQVYIALGNAMTVAGALEIDTCPIEGFERDKYNKILGLPEKGLDAAVVLAVGYRSEEDTNQSLEKVRKPISELVTNL